MLLADAPITRAVSSCRGDVCDALRADERAPAGNAAAPKQSACTGGRSIPVERIPRNLSTFEAFIRFGGCDGRSNARARTEIRRTARANRASCEYVVLP